MISYKKVTLEDKEWVREKLKESNLRGSEYCFTNQFLWGNKVGMEIAMVEGCLCTVYHRGGRAVHDYPTGNGSTREAILKLLQDDKEKEKITVFRGVLDSHKEWMERNFPGKFEYTETRDEWDYLYLTEELAALTGRRFHAKRNHIARLEETGEWYYEEMTPDNIDPCREMYLNWFQQNKERLDSSADREKEIVDGCFSHFRDLELQGGLLKLRDQVIGFSIGAPLNSDTFIVHIEKADPNVRGAYPMINREFVRQNMLNFQYVNREDDLGLEGLRKAKLSYHPQLLLQKHEARLK